MGIDFARFRAGAVMLLLGGLAGCAQGPARGPVALAVRPAQFNFDQSAPATPVTGWWWRSFGNEELDTTVQRVLAGNLSLAAARARLAQLDAVRARARTTRWPQASVGAGWDHDLERTPERSDGWQVDLSVTSAVDIFDRLGALAAQRDWEWVAQGERLHATQLAVAATTVELYYGVVAQRQLLALLQDQASTAREVLGLIERRYEQGLISRLDVLQQRGQVAEIATLVPAAEDALQLLLTELTVLAGLPSGSFDTLATGVGFATLEPLFPAGEPFDLLQARPDLRAAQADLQAVDADLSRAVAERWPRLSFSGSVAWLNGRAVNGSPVAALAADLVQPLLDWGGRRMEVARVQALREERLLALSQAFLRAVADLESAVKSEERQRELMALLEDRGNLLRETLRQANRRYESGLTDYLPVLSVTQQLHALEQRMVRENRTLMSLRVDQFVGIGGPMPALDEKLAGDSVGGGDVDAREVADALDQLAQ